MHFVERLACMKSALMRNHYAEWADMEVDSHALVYTVLYRILEHLKNQKINSVKLNNEVCVVKSNNGIYEAFTKESYIGSPIFEIFSFTVGNRVSRPDWLIPLECLQPDDFLMYQHIVKYTEKLSILNRLRKGPIYYCIKDRIKCYDIRSRLPIYKDIKPQVNPKPASQLCLADLIYEYFSIHLSLDALRTSFNTQINNELRLGPNYRLAINTPVINNHSVYPTAQEILNIGKFCKF